MNILGYCKNHPLRVYIVLITLLKLIIVGGLPIFAIVQAPHDDGLMVSNAIEILKGEWLGPYSQFTLIKGVFFPFFLSICYILNIPFAIGQTFYYAAACSFFVWVIRGILKNPAACGFVYTVLFFAPVTYSAGAFMRIYRCNLSPAQILFLFAFFIGMYFNRNSGIKALFFWGLGAGLSLAVMWNTREDAFWVMPFVLGTICMSIVGSWMSSPRRTLQLKIYRSSVFVMPLVVLLSLNSLISFVNMHNYGMYTRIELDDGNFPRMMRAIYSIEPEEVIYRTSVPKSTVDKIYNVSPTFALLKPILERNFGAGWDATDQELDGQIKDGWFFWCLRDSVACLGYYNTPQNADAFYGRVADEIEVALKDGRLIRRNGIVMPSALMSPWRSAYAGEMISAIKDTYKFILAYGDSNLPESFGDFYGIRRFENVTHSLAIHPSKNRLSVQGWAISYNDDSPLTVMLSDGGQSMVPVTLSGGKDVYDGFLKNGDDLKNALNCRFNITVDNTENKKYHLYLYKGGHEVEKIPLDSSIDHGGSREDGYTYYFDSILSDTLTDPTILTGQPRVKFLNRIVSIYRSTANIFALIGVLGYLAISASLLYTTTMFRTMWLDEWLILSGILGSLFVLIVGVSYVHISAFSTLTDFYLSAAYPMLISFCAISIVVIINKLKDLYKGKIVILNTRRSD